MRAVRAFQGEVLYAFTLWQHGSMSCTSRNFRTNLTIMDSPHILPGEESWGPLQRINNCILINKEVCLEESLTSKMRMCGTTGKGILHMLMLCISNRFQSMTITCSMDILNFIFCKCFLSMGGPQCLQDMWFSFVVILMHSIAFALPYTTVALPPVQILNTQ